MVDPPKNQNQGSDPTSTVAGDATMQREPPKGSARAKGKESAGESGNSGVNKFIDPDAWDDPATEQMLEQRLASLREYLRKRRSAVIVTNAGLETGRPKLQVPDDMLPDPTNPYNRPTLEALCQIKPKPVSNNMATSEDMMRIFNDLEGLGVPSEHVQQVLIQAVIYCKDASSSVYLDPRGTFEWPQGAIAADSVIAVLKKDAETLRRVCRLYAPVTWAYMLAHNAPPSDWAAMGFHYNDRFAAFDCFDYVENPAAVQPAEGLVRRPTPREKLAHSTHKDIALRAANRNQAFGNFSAEITGGKDGPELVRDYSKSSNK